MSEEHQQSYHHMRGAIALLTELALPATPQNYAVCFEHVAGSNDELSKVMGALLESREPGNSDAAPYRQIEDYYYQYVMRLNEKYLQQIQQDVIKLLANIHSSLANMRGDTERYDATLEFHHRQMCESPAIKTLCEMLEVLRHETASMQQSGEVMEGQLVESISEVERLRQDLEVAKREASIDYLTGLANRKSFMADLSEAIDEENKKQHGLCLLIADIDLFKEFNDKFGHLLGDKVLSFVANTMSKSLRGSDTIARYGGEEFIVLLRGTPYTGAMTVAEQLRTTIEKAKLVQAGTKKSLPSVNISIGVAKYRHGESVDELIDRTDKALYRSKERGRNCITGEKELHTLERG